LKLGSHAGREAVFPNLYKDNPVSPIAVNIDALWKILNGIFSFLHFKIKEM